MPDDNLLACSDDHVEKVFQMLGRQDHRAVFTGGLEEKILKPWHAKRMKEIKAQRMYFAYDTPDDYEPLVEAGKILRAEGHRPEGHSMGCYCLIGHPKDTFSDAEKRLDDFLDWLARQPKEAPPKERTKTRRIPTYIPATGGPIPYRK